ncbi:MAG: hypothetical protein GY830_03635 [Bacteroidetes bacterium]|nr:hypothetical protein [Bacteroidota bacterium]
MLEDLFYNLKGQWHLIKNLGDFGIMEGNACFKLIEDHILHFRESGIVIRDDKNQNKVYRDYMYKLDKKTNQILVYFSSNNKINNLFQTLVFDKNFKKAYGSHICNLDFYDSNYEFNNENNFKITYKVNGPKKNFQIISEYQRS